MKEFIIGLIILIAAGILVMTIACCRAAGKADEEMERHYAQMQNKEGDDNE